MKVIEHKILVIPILLITIGLIYGSVTTALVFAQTPAGCSESDPKACPNSEDVYKGAPRELLPDYNINYNITSNNDDILSSGPIIIPDDQNANQ